MNFVLDCSIAMAWYFEDEATEFTDSVLESLAERSAKVPSVWLLEVANVLVVSERKGQGNQAKITRFLQLLNDLPIAVDTGTAEKAFTDILALARSSRLTAYDAAYLELALREGLPIATLDKELKQAAETLGVLLF